VIFTPLMIRVSRGAALSVAEEPYVLAARAVGASQTRVALRHVLPNSLAPVVAIAANLMGAAVVGGWPQLSGAGCSATGAVVGQHVE
jgi:ABC-type dipeptide/oligopeptide/nickel transport system permease subunit